MGLRAKAQVEAEMVLSQAKEELGKQKQTTDALVEMQQTGFTATTPPPQPPTSLADIAADAQVAAAQTQLKAEEHASWQEKVEHAAEQQPLQQQAAATVEDPSQGDFVAPKAVAHGSELQQDGVAAAPKEEYLVPTAPTTDQFLLAVNSEEAA